MGAGRLGCRAALGRIHYGIQTRKDRVMADNGNLLPPFVALLQTSNGLLAMDEEGDLYEYVRVRIEGLMTHADTPAGHGAHGYEWVWKWHSNIRDGCETYLRMKTEGRIK